MPRRPAQITQGVIRAAKQAGAIEVVVKIGDQSLIVRLMPSTGVEVPLAPDNWNAVPLM
jgi:hypothetical protein